MKFVRLRARHARLRAHKWLRGHPGADRFLRAWGCLGLHDGAVPRGIAVGLFIGLTPTVGLQTLLMVVGCMLLRGNFPSAFAVSWVSNPLTLAPLFLTFNAIGETLFGPVLGPVFRVAGAGEEVALETLFLVLGSLCVALPAALAGYAIATRLEFRVATRRRLRSRRNSGGRHRPPGAGAS